MSDEALNIVLTGGGSGIGAAIARILGKDGHKVIICGRRENKLKKTAKSSTNILYKKCDVSNENNVLDFLNFVKSKFNYVDVLINCAGIFGEVNRFDKTDSKLWKKTFEINTFGTYLSTKHFLKLISKSNKKKIINFSGGGAFSPFPNYSAYAVSKAAVVRFSENLATELKDLGITVNCVAPGFVATALHEATLKAGKEKAGKHYDVTIEKLKKGSVPIDTPVNCVKFLISDESNDLTGKTISANFDSWNSDTFKKAIKELNSSDLYALRRVNLVNLDPDDSLRVKLTKVQKRG